MRLSFTPLPQTYAISRLPGGAPVPDWANGTGLVSLTRANDELSIVCEERRVPSNVLTDRGWTALRVDTLADLDVPGVVAAAVAPVSRAGFGVFVISTHLRDYLLVRRDSFTLIQQRLEAAGHDVV